ncbi:MAG: helix-turn-helix domain-containing protein, partial [Dehalococcoidia bacterium]
MANPLSPMLVQLLERLTENESLQIEFKDARGGLPRSIWETVSAFANTEGGWVILGVNDKREIVGVPNPEHQVDELHSQSRNRQIISWAAFGPGDVSTEALGARQVVVVRVWAAPRAELPVHLRGNPFQGTYLRRGTGDYQATEAEVKRMLRDAGGDSSADGRAIPGLGTDALDMRTVAAYRQSFRLRKPSDAWNDYDNERFLVALGATVTGVDGPEVTRAGVLMFGRDQALRAWRGRHLIDYRETDRLLEGRWQDRVVVESGLYDAFREIYPRLTVGLPTPFRLDGVTRVDEGPAQIAVREALVNLLVHADYVEQQPSLILRSPDEI